MKKMILFGSTCLISTILAAQLLPQKKQPPGYLAGSLANYETGANRGDPKSMFLLAETFSLGIGRDKDYSQAHLWYQKAAGLGYGLAWYKLGMLYKYGLGVPQNFVKAFSLFSKSADLSCKEGIYSKGYLLYKGIGCKQDYSAAVKLFLIAANAGSAEAMYFLGLCYRNGWGVTQNKSESISWLVAASRKGNVQATAELFEPESENTSVSPKMAAMLSKAETTGGGKFALHKYSDKGHEKNFTNGELDGEFSGYLLRYDWSGTKVVSIVPLTMKISGTNNKISGKWHEGDFNDVEINASLTTEALIFNTAVIKRVDHYNKQAAKISLKKARLQVQRYPGKLVLEGTLDAYADEKKEPEKPTKFILVKDIQKSQSKKSIEKISNVLENTGSGSISISAFPNPSSGEITIRFSLPKSGNVVASIIDGTGKVVFLGSKKYFPDGKNNMMIKPQIPPGSYFVKLHTENGEVLMTTLIRQ